MSDPLTDADLVAIGANVAVEGLAAEVEQLRQQLYEADHRAELAEEEERNWRGCCHALEQANEDAEKRAEEADERRQAWKMQAEKVERECEAIRRQASELRRMLTEFRVVMGGQQTGNFRAEDLVPVWLEVCVYLDNAALISDAGKGVEKGV